MGIRIIPIAVLVAFISIPSAVFSGEKPGWVLKGGYASYDAKLYLTGTGVAPSTADAAADIGKADASARAEIARQIRVSLYEDLSTSEDSVTETEYGEKKVLKESSKFKVSVKNRQTVNLELQGVEIAQRFFDADANLYYSLAVLNRLMAAARYSTEAASGFGDARKKAANAEIMLRRGAFVDGITALIAAAGLYEKALDNDRIACILGDRSVKADTSFDPDGMLVAAAGRVVLECRQGCSQKARIGDSLPEPVLLRAAYSPAGVPVANLPVKLRYQDEDTARAEVFRTGPDGCVLIRTGPIRRTGKKDNAVEIIPAWDVLEKEALGGDADSWRGMLCEKGAAVRYETRNEASTTVVISECLEIDGRRVEDTVAAGMLADALRTAGFMVSIEGGCIADGDIEDAAREAGTKAELLVIIDADAKRSAYSSGNVYRAGISFTCHDMTRKEVVASVKGMGVGMAARDREAADRALANACSESAKVFIEKIRENLR